MPTRPSSVVDLAIRTYHEGIHTVEIEPVGVLLVEPVDKPTVTEQGLLLAGEEHKLHVCFAQVHQVRAVPRGHDGYRVGEYVVCRAAHIDPIGPQGRIGSIRPEHVVGRVGVGAL